MFDVESSVFAFSTMAGYTGTATVTVAAPPAATSSTSYVSYWSHDATSNAGSEPTGHVTLPVTKGLYSVLLGDSTLAGMGTIPSTLFANPDIRLRIWFNDGSHGFQLMTPDQRIISTIYLSPCTTHQPPDAAWLRARA